MKDSRHRGELRCLLFWMKSKIITTVKLNDFVIMFSFRYLYDTKQNNRLELRFVV